MKKLFTLFFISASFYCNAQNLNPNSFMLLWDKRDQEPLIINSIENMGFSYYDSENDGQSTTMIFQAKKSKNCAVIIDKENDEIIGLKYNSYNQSDYKIYLE